MSEKTIRWANFEDDPTLTRDEAAPPRLNEKLSCGKALITKYAAIKAVNDVLAAYIPSFRPWEERIPLECAIKIKELSHAEPRPVKPGELTPDDVETIRIHLSAIKEGLCNQGRWREAQEYEDLIERFLYATSAAGHYRPQDRRTENND